MYSVFSTVHVLYAYVCIVHYGTCMNVPITCVHLVFSFCEGCIGSVQWSPGNGQVKPQTPVLMCGCVLHCVMLLTLAVVLPTPYDHIYSGTFQGGYSARVTASRWAVQGARMVLLCISSRCCVCTVQLEDNAVDTEQLLWPFKGTVPQWVEQEHRKVVRVHLDMPHPFVYALTYPHPLPL